MLLSLVRTIGRRVCIWGHLGAFTGRVKKLKARHLNKSNQSKFGPVQPLFHNDDMLACIIRVLSVPRRKMKTTILYFNHYYCHLNARKHTSLHYSPVSSEERHAAQGQPTRVVRCFNKRSILHTVGYPILSPNTRTVSKDQDSFSVLIYFF
jgi:hypothetical protein